MKRVILLLGILSVAFAAYGLDTRQQNINRIKKSRAFLYSDVTMSTREDAASHAYEQIQHEILNWARQRTNRTINNVSVSGLNTIIDTICVRRAEMHRVVAFVRKTKVASTFSDWNLKLDEELDTDANNPSVLKENQPKDTIVRIEVYRDTVAVSPPAQKDTVQKGTVANADIRTLLKNNFLGKKGGVLDQIKKARSFFELKQIMEPLKQKGEITDYGKYATATKPEDCYLVVYDPAGNIRAVLGKGEKTRKNLKTGKEDSIKNYRGCGAIWFTIKE